MNISNLKLRLVETENNTIAQNQETWERKDEKRPERITRMTYTEKDEKVVREVANEIFNLITSYATQRPEEIGTTHIILALGALLTHFSFVSGLPKEQVFKALSTQFDRLTKDLKEE